MCSGGKVDRFVDFLPLLLLSICAAQLHRQRLTLPRDRRRVPRLLSLSLSLPSLRLPPPFGRIVTTAFATISTAVAASTQARKQAMGREKRCIVPRFCLRASTSLPLRLRSSFLASFLPPLLILSLSRLCSCCSPDVQMKIYIPCFATRFLSPSSSCSL